MFRTDRSVKHPARPVQARLEQGRFGQIERVGKILARSLDPLGYRIFLPSAPILWPCDLNW